MSEITYTLRSPKLVKNVLVELETPQGLVTKVHARVASMSFLYQPLYDFWYGDKYNAPYWRIQARLEKLWKTVNEADIPMFAAFTDCKKNHKIDVGQEVYFWHDKDGKTWDKVPFEHYTGNDGYIGILGRIVKVYND
jgi:hypothetical protein